MFNYLLTLITQYFCTLQPHKSTTLNRLGYQGLKMYSLRRPKIRVLVKFVVLHSKMSMLVQFESQPTKLQPTKSEITQRRKNEKLSTSQTFWSVVKIFLSLFSRLLYYSSSLQARECGISWFNHSSCLWKRDILTKRSI